ncbi:MAG: hypothetical protein ACKO8Z_10805 [Prosthecobacter sp.]
MKPFFSKYGGLWWLPAVIYLGLLGLVITVELLPWGSRKWVSEMLSWCSGIAFLGIVGVSVRHFCKKQWRKGFLGLFLSTCCALATMLVISLLMVASMFGPSKDGFADHLHIPSDIVISEPEPDVSETADAGLVGSIDAMQDSVRQALKKAGGGEVEFTPEMPSLRRAASEQLAAFLSYVEASPDWHVFLERGNRFASRRWSYGGVPRDTLHGYISDFSREHFQTRCLLCLDQKQWSAYSVQQVREGKTPVVPKMSQGNALNESRVMIDCGGVWVEIFEQSDRPERRITKAAIAVLEQEFSHFLVNPAAALEQARLRSRELAKHLAGSGEHPIRLLQGMQPGIYGAAYVLNSGAPGSVYLKAFEVTHGIRLSADRLEAASRTRMAWSKEPNERFGAKTGFTIDEGDWGKPYAARFEVWFTPDAGGPERKLAERIFKIEGWQR